MSKDLNEIVLAVALGVFIGYLEAFNVNILLGRARTWRNGLDGITKTMGQILAIPSFAVGGPFLSTQLLSWTTPEAFASPYLIAFVIVLIYGTQKVWRQIADAAPTAGAPRPRRRTA